MPPVKRNTLFLSILTILMGINFSQQYINKTFLFSFW